MDIEKIEEDQIERELLNFSFSEQASIKQLLCSQRLGNYDDELQSMDLLSSANARHRILATRYDGLACMLKAFELHISQGQGLRHYRDDEYLFSLSKAAP